MTKTRQRAFTVGMRVVVRDGPWPAPRIAGHYGKVAEIIYKAGMTYVRVDLTGHIDGRAPNDLVVEAMSGGWFYPEELDVVD